MSRNEPVLLFISNIQDFIQDITLHFLVTVSLPLLAEPVSQASLGFDDFGSFEVHS